MTGCTPTSGGAPYEVYEVTPVKAFGFPIDGETITPTRWTWPSSIAQQAASPS
jgi:hypothetical protein